MGGDLYHKRFINVLSQTRTLGDISGKYRGGGFSQELPPEMLPALKDFIKETDLQHCAVPGEGLKITLCV